MKQPNKLISTFVLLISFTFYLHHANAANYYWVGGSGNWSANATHWATTSGGASFYSQVPTTVDDVFFDANSFSGAGQTVTVDQTIVTCRDMNWTGSTNTPAFAGASSTTCKIYGSLTFISAMTNSFGGMVNFESTTTGKTITSAGKSYNNTVNINGVGGAWTLQDALTIIPSQIDDLILNGGTLNTNGMAVTVGHFAALTSAVRVLNLGASVFTMSGNGAASASPWFTSNQTNLTVNAGTSEIKFTGNGTGASCPALYIGTTMTFFKITFTGDGQIANGGTTCTTLTLAAGCTYQFQSGRTQTIAAGGSIVTTGTCTSVITITSTSGGSVATFSKSSGTITTDYTAMQDITAAGGAAFTANHTTNLGNNASWTINAPSTQSLYWVGGTGNWNDANHWSTSSGGAGGACLPTAGDDVFFDANSFSGSGQTVTINCNLAYCRDMTWTGATGTPVLAGASTIGLKIYGSLTFISGMTLSYLGDIYMNATSTGKTVTTAGRTILKSIQFDGAGGGWTLQDALTTAVTGNYELYLTKGTLNTNGQAVTVGKFYSSNTNTRALTLGATLFTLSGDGQGGISPWRFTTQTGMTLTANTSEIKFTGTGTGGSCPTLYNGTGMTFNIVTFTGEGELVGNNTFTTLNLTAGKTYTLFQGNTQTITAAGSINATGTCTSLISLATTTSGTIATISKPSGTLTISYFIMKDITASGGATFTANNTTNLGNNAGWTINSPSSLSLYWIGGTGNWNDPNHWALTSGGAGGACLPTPVDDVFFNANSFSSGGQTVTVNVNTAYCRDMNWTGATGTPVFTGISTYILKIYGSLTFISAMSMTFAGDVYFEATTTGKTITSNGKTFLKTVQFNGAGGYWTLQDAMAVTASGSADLYLNKGTLNTNGMAVSMGKFYTNNSNVRALILGASVITISGSGNGGSSPWFVGTQTNMTLTAGTSEIILSGSTSGSRAFYNNTGFTFYKVTFLGDAQITGANTFETLKFTAGKAYSIPASTIQTITASGTVDAHGSGSFPIDIITSSGGTQGTFSKVSGIVCMEWVRLKDLKAQGGATWYASQSTDNGNNNATWQWTSSTCSVVLPVQLTSFTAVKNNDAVNLTWQTSSELNDAYFAVQRSSNGNNFEEIDRRIGAGTSTTITNYSVVDNEPLPGLSYYRLLQVDRNGHYTYSEMRMINFAAENTSVSVYPNPFVNTINVSFATEGNYIIAIYNETGMLVMKGTCSLTNLTLDTQELPAGIYLVRVANENGETILGKMFVKGK